MVKTPTQLYGVFDDELSDDISSVYDDDQENSESTSCEHDDFEDVLHQNDLRGLLAGLVTGESRVLRDEAVNMQNMNRRVKLDETEHPKNTELIKPTIGGMSESSDSENESSSNAHLSPRPISRFEERIRCIEQFGKEDWEDFSFSNAFDSDMSEPESNSEEFVAHAEQVLFSQNGGLLSRQSSANSVELSFRIDSSEFTIPGSPSAAELSERVDELSKKIRVARKRTNTDVLKNVKDRVRLSGEKRGSDISLGKITPRRTLNLTDYTDILLFKDAGLVYDSGKIGEELERTRQDLKKVKERWLLLQAEDESASISEAGALLESIQSRVEKYVSLDDTSASNRRLYESAESLYSVALRTKNLITAMDWNRRIFQQQLSLETQGDRAARIEWLVTKSETDYIIE